MKPKTIFDDPLFWDMYHEERNKLSTLPNDDCDMIALEIALNRYPLND